MEETPKGRPAGPKLAEAFARTPHQSHVSPVTIASGSFSHAQFPAFIHDWRQNPKGDYEFRMTVDYRNRELISDLILYGKDKILSVDILPWKVANVGTDASEA